MDKPKDHTVILVDGKPRNLYYGDYLFYNNLPLIAKDEEIKREYDTFWYWLLLHNSEEEKE